MKKDFETLRNALLSCQNCQKLFGFEPHPVVQGTAQSKIFQISQAPSKTVHVTHKPFNDLSGKRLIHEWYQISSAEFYNPEYFYITSMANCFPGKAPGGGDRKPPKICAQTWLEGQMDLVNNQIYIVIGRYAADYFFPKRRFDELVFTDQKIRGKKAFILPHPSPLNMKWFHDHLEFEQSRIKTIRAAVYQILGKN